MHHKKHKIPDSIYYLLPYFYIVTGLSIIMIIGNHLALFSGTVLLAAGILVLKMRRNYSLSFQGIKTTNRDKKTLKIKKSKSGSSQLIWSKKFECGNRAIDAQHKKLFEIGNHLLDHIVRNNKHSDIVKLVNILINEIHHHFKSEEELPL